MQLSLCRPPPLKVLWGPGCWIGSSDTQGLGGCWVAMVMRMMLAAPWEAGEWGRKKLRVFSESWDAPERHVPVRDELGKVSAPRLQLLVVPPNPPATKARC